MTWLIMISSFVLIEASVYLSSHLEPVPKSHILKLEDKRNVREILKGDVFKRLHAEVLSSV